MLGAGKSWALLWVRMVGVLVVCMGLVVVGAMPVHAATAASDPNDRWWYSSDNDTCPDWVELALTGSVTALSSLEVNRHGVSQCLSFMAYGDPNKADPKVDRDQDGVPDFVGLVLSKRKSARLSDPYEKNDNGVYLWVSVLICGSGSCATGREDLNKNGISDADELSGCYRSSSSGFLPFTGANLPFTVAVLVAAVVLVAGGSYLLVRRRRVSGRPGGGRHAREAAAMSSAGSESVAVAGVEA